MIEYLADIAAVDYPRPDSMTIEADLADWIEQQQTLPQPDDDYPHYGRPRTSSTEFWAD